MKFNLVMHDIVIGDIYSYDMTYSVTVLQHKIYVVVLAIYEILIRSYFMSRLRTYFTHSYVAKMATTIK